MMKIKTKAEQQQTANDGLVVRIKRISTTDEGKYTLVVEGEALSGAGLQQVQELLELQQGDVVMRLSAMQADLFQ